jgi:flagella basal body P-ring formation protein FlgA
MRATLLILTVCCLTTPANAATLRVMTTLHGPHVMLSDLFDDAGANATHVLGPGPAPGGRIVVESAQLAAIARQFGVDWKPSSNADRAVLDWPGRPLPRDAALAALRDALAANGVDGDCEIDLAGFTPPMVPFEGTPRPVVSQLDYDRLSGRFSSVLSVTEDGIDPINTRLTGRVDEMVTLPVATARLAAGTVLRAEDIHIGRVRVAATAPRELVRDVDAAVGQQLRHPVMPGQPFGVADLTRPALVRRGADVLIQLDSPGIALTAKGQALESGAIGERIHVMNPGSHAVIEAEVTGADRVQVAPGALPLLAARTAGQVVIR